MTTPSPARTEPDRVRSQAELAASREVAFSRMLDLVFDGHPYYRGVFERVGLRRSDLPSLAQLSRLPETPKSAFTDAPDDFVLRPTSAIGLTLPERTMWGAIYTSGTSGGDPTPFWDTAYDHAARIDQMRAACHLAGIDATDLVANVFPISAVPHQGFLSATYGPLAVGARLVAGLPGNQATPFDIHRSTDEIARQVAAHEATVLWGITSYVRRVVISAEHQGLSFASVRMLFVAGESCPPGMADDLRVRLERLGSPGVAIQNGYGFTEMQGPTIRCAPDGPFHVPTPARYLFEIVNERTGSPREPGERGRLLVSHLDRRGTVLLRYAVGDQASIREGVCDQCGRPGTQIVGPIRRSDRLIKVKGTLVDPDRVIAAVSAVGGIEEFQVVARRPDGHSDELLIRIVAPDDPILRDAIERAVRDSCEIRPAVEIVGRRTLERDGGGYKFRRFIDMRGES